MNSTNEILIYELSYGQVEVRVDGDTVWLSLNQLVDLFQRDKSVISKHISNIFNEQELSKNSVVANFATTAADGKTYQVDHYNLDVIISVGYRVKSKRGTQFRQWATKVLRDNLVKGFSVNQSKLAERGLTEIQQTITLLTRTLENQTLVSDLGRNVLALIASYAKTWTLLLQYDEDNLLIPPGCQPAKGILSYTEAVSAIKSLKKELISKGEAAALFGNELDLTLKAILGNIEQVVFDEVLYQTREERAAHLLYFIIKDHPFTDGNKRIGCFLFLLYLKQENMRMPDEGSLTALALLIAESDPKQKALIIKLIVNIVLCG